MAYNSYIFDYILSSDNLDLLHSVCYIVKIRWTIARMRGTGRRPSNLLAASRIWPERTFANSLPMNEHRAASGCRARLAMAEASNTNHHIMKSPPIKSKLIKLISGTSKKQDNLNARIYQSLILILCQITVPTYGSQQHQYSTSSEAIQCK